MRIFAGAALALTLAFSGSVAAAKNMPAKSSEGNQVLLRALNAMVSQRDNPPGQSRRPTDPDMGDDNASERAILVVCSMNTPAARRSAICDRRPVSPD